MKEVTENYTKITTEVGTWETLEDDAAIKKSIDDTLLPLVNGHLKNSRVLPLKQKKLKQ